MCGDDWNFAAVVLLVMIYVAFLCFLLSREAL
jgi:hypothetical protein